MCHAAQVNVDLPEGATFEKVIDEIVSKLLKFNNNDFFHTLLVNWDILYVSLLIQW